MSLSLGAKIYFFSFVRPLNFVKRAKLDVIEHRLFKRARLDIIEPRLSPFIYLIMSRDSELLSAGNVEGQGQTMHAKKAIDVPSSVESSITDANGKENNLACTNTTGTHGTAITMTTATPDNPFMAEQQTSAENIEKPMCMTPTKSTRMARVEQQKTIRKELIVTFRKHLLEFCGRNNDAQVDGTTSVEQVLKEKENSYQRLYEMMKRLTAEEMVAMKIHNIPNLWSPFLKDATDFSQQESTMICLIKCIAYFLYYEQVVVHMLPSQLEPVIRTLSQLVLSSRNKVNILAVARDFVF